jgi:nicotinic acid phosphoribosyltransferase
MDAETVRWVITALFGAIMWFWKRGIDETAKNMAVMHTEIQLLKDTRLHKDDFREFKVELRAQFEELKTAIRDSKFNAS